MPKILIHYLGKLVVKLHEQKKLDIYALRSLHSPEKYKKNGVKRKIPESVRWTVWRRDGFMCVYCLADTGPLTLDHIVPECKGGLCNPKNLVTACPGCNNKKADSNIQTFMRDPWLINKRKQNLKRLSITQQIIVQNGLDQTYELIGATV